MLRDCSYRIVSECIRRLKANMKSINSGLFTLALVAQNIAYGSVITVEFDVTIISKRSTSFQSEPFTPMEHQFASLTFDNTLASVDRLWTPVNPIMSHVWSSFGSPNQTKLVSPISNLTQTNLIANAPVIESSNMRSLLWYSLDPVDHSTVSFAHQIQAEATMRSKTHTNGPYSYEGESWERTLSISSPADYYGAMDDASIAAYDYRSNDLMAYLSRTKDNQAKWFFFDGFTYANRPNLLLSGFSWSGTAVITNILDNESVDVPEPSSMALTWITLIGLAFTRRKSE